MKKAIIRNIVWLDIDTAKKLEDIAKKHNVATNTVIRTVIERLAAEEITKLCFEERYCKKCAM
ncbi:MAG: hypothetical protein QXI92_00540, partial [Candidatus Nitrosocaldus sp.]